ncbi:AraC family transcriptional regulator [Paenibacillus koleovorans]|uniref:AraC family transcriptional regulator n=1 Tax=Paenibacillus koleovorans TaxID=121608 RepID=UPI000FDC1130|nr:AraC family transcriptional regulator [Paenibacillus koleovorans]
MTMYPIYEDALQLRNVTNTRFPFYTGLHVHGSYPIHHHELIEFGLVLHGEGTTVINGSTYSIRPGSMLIVLPHHIHSFVSDGEQRLEQLCCMFDMQILADALLEPELSAALLRVGDDLEPVLSLDEETFRNVRSLYGDIQQEFNSTEPGRNSLIRAKLVELVLQFIRQHPQMRDQTPISQKGKKKDAWKLVQYVNTHYMEESVTLELLSSMFLCSVPYISRSFKDLVGQSFLSYLHALRIRRASSLLAATQMNVSDIAAEVGFESFRTFSRVFKELKGVTPSEFRQAATAASAAEATTEPSAATIDVH